MVQALRTILLMLLVGGICAAAEPSAQVVATFVQRLNEIDQRDPAALDKLASWARSHGLNQQAARLYRKILAIDPDHETAYQQLCAIADNSRLPGNPDAAGDLLEQLGEDFDVHIAPHFIIVFNTDKKWAVNRAVLLEKTHDLFHQHFRRAGLRPLPLDQRLVCILFDQHEQFVDYARRVDRAVLGWSSGYYSMRTNRIAFFHDKDHPQFEQVRQQMAGLEKQIASLEQQIAQAIKARNHAIVAELRRQLSDQRKRLRWFENRLEAIQGLTNTAKTIHEAVHQLAFNTGIQSREVAYPFWLSEGLATSFESDDPAGSFGPYHDNPARREVLERARNAKRLMPLPEFVGLCTLQDQPDERITDLYAQGWGLFRFLFRTRHDELRQYLEAIDDLPPGPRESNEMLEEFEAAFGPMERVESDWQVWLRRIR